jgi:hypothetical protein
MSGFQFKSQVDLKCRKTSKQIQGKTKAKKKKNTLRERGRKLSGTGDEPNYTALG